MQLRDYQERTLEQLDDWLCHNSGDPCVVLPTGAGKSVIIAEFCKRLITSYPDMRILMLTHVRELVEQNANKLRELWPNAPLGIYSAGLRKRQLGRAITFAGVQSLRGKADQIGRVNVIIIDECHLVNHEDSGTYRDLINDLKKDNPKLRVIGTTATPWRLGHGKITDSPALFDELLEPTSIEELIYRGYLANLRSKSTDAQYDLSEVKKRGGEFVEKDLAAACDTDDQNDQVVREVISLAGDRKAWLFFCADVGHALHMRDSLNAHGIPAACVTGETPTAQRDEILEKFKRGEYRALTNVNVLSTGFDYPDIDLLAMCRGTMSPVLYVQQVGRGLRLKSHTDHCLVLDFAGVVRTHGPITNITAPDKRSSDGNGECPVKICENCNELVHTTARECPVCLTPFPEPEKKELTLHYDDVIEIEIRKTGVDSWHWESRLSKSGKDMLRVSYFGSDFDAPNLQEFVCLRHDGYALKMAKRQLKDLSKALSTDLDPGAPLEELAELLNRYQPPMELTYKKDGNWWRIIDKKWPDVIEPPADLDELFEDDDIPF